MKEKTYYIRNFRKAKEIKKIRKIANVDLPYEIPQSTLTEIEERLKKSGHSEKLDPSLFLEIQEESDIAIILPNKTKVTFKKAELPENFEELMEKSFCERNCPFFGKCETMDAPDGEEGGLMYWCASMPMDGEYYIKSIEEA